MKRRNALFAERRFPVRRYGRTTRAQYRGAVEGSSSVYQVYSRRVRSSGESFVPRIRCFSAS